MSELQQKSFESKGLYSVGSEHRHLSYFVKNAIGCTISVYSITLSTNFLGTLDTGKKWKKV